MASAFCGREITLNLKLATQISALSILALHIISFGFSAYLVTGLTILTNPFTKDINWNEDNPDPEYDQKAVEKEIYRLILLLRFALVAQFMVQIVDIIMSIRLFNGASKGYITRCFHWYVYSIVILVLWVLGLLWFWSEVGFDFIGYVAVASVFFRILVIILVRFYILQLYRMECSGDEDEDENKADSDLRKIIPQVVDRKVQNV